MGMVDISTSGDSLTNCNFYACPGHKWLNGAPGTGVLYIQNEKIRPPEFYPTLSQRMGKYTSCSHDTDACFPMAEALQVRGCSNTPGFAAMIQAMKFVQDAGGPAKIEQHILGLSREVKNFIFSHAPQCLISPHADPGLQSGLTSFFPFNWDQPQTPLKDRKTAEWVVQELLKRKIQVRSIGFADTGSSSQASELSYAIRVSTAWFNTADQIESFRNALQEVLRRVSIP